MRRAARYSVSAGALLIIAAAIVFDMLPFLLLVLVAAAAHELGHYLAIRICGRGEGAEIRLGPLGVTIRRGPPATYMHEAAIAAAGPLASALLAMLAALMARLTQFEPAYTLSGMSLMFSLFNILPVFPLDGGRVLFAVTAQRFGLTAAERTVCVISCAVIFALLCAGAYILVATGTNFTLLGAAAWLLVYYCRNNTGNVFMSA